MNNTTIVQPNETLMDVAIRTLGAAWAIFDLAAANGLGLTDTVSPGQVLVVPTLASQPAPATDTAPAPGGSLVTVQPGQVLLDIAIQCCGNTAAAFDLAAVNGLSLTADITAGQELRLPPVDMSQKRTVRLFKEGGWKPATGPFMLPQGISYWGISYDFIVTP